METTQICTCCNTEKSISEFAFRTDIQKYRRQCKECKNIQARKNYDKQKDNEEFMIKRRGYAKKNYPKTSVRAKERRKEIEAHYIQYRKEYREKNYERVRQKEKEYYHNNKEIKKEYAEKNKDKIREKQREYYLSNKNLFKEKRQEYRKTEKGKMVYKNSNNKRRAKIMEGNIKTEDLQLLIENSKTCYWCNIKLNKNYHIDHYVALSKGGTHTIDNIVISCPDCNLRKNAKDPYEFALTKGKLL